jgi:mono/diheme cytochrome c family protein
MQFSPGALVLFAGMIVLLGLLVAYASGVGQRAHVPVPDVPTGNPSMERKVVVTLGLLIISGLLLTGYSFVEPRRQDEALKRQEGIAVHRAIENYTTLCMGCHGVDGTGALVPDQPTALVAPALNRPDLRPDPNDKDAFNAQYTFVNKTIHRGRTGTPMPAWGKSDGGALLDEQIHELTLLILKGDMVVQGKPAWELVTEIGREKIAHGSPEPKRPTEDVTMLSPEAQAGGRIFTGKGGCVGCHNAGSGGGATGPNLSRIGTEGGSRKPGTDAAAYITESLNDPQAFLVSGFAPIMPSFRGTLSEEEINQVVQYLLTKQ